MFVVFMLLSIGCFLIALVWAGILSERCPGPGDRDVTAQCTYEGEAQGNAALILAIGGMTLMLGGVAVQSGVASVPINVPPPTGRIPPPPPGSGGTGGYPTPPQQQPHRPQG